MNASHPRLVLGSASPRRLEVLAQLGVTPEDVRPADIDETPSVGELPRTYCLRVTEEKAKSVARSGGEVVLAADTVVAVGRRILGKPKDRDEAETFLRLLSGRRHKVHTAIAVLSDDGLKMRDVVCTVRMQRLGENDLAGYLDTGDWKGKAGAYAIQGPAGAFIPWIAGSYTAIMGLPAHETARLLTTAGIPVPSRS